MQRRSRLLTYHPLAILIAAGCQHGPGSQGASHPPEFVGRWLRETPDVNAGDTLELLSDGTVKGLVGGVPHSATWLVKEGPAGILVFCASASDGSYCRTYQIDAKTLSLSGGPTAPTIFHRLPGR